ncbi:MAG: hypothetical protein M3203_04820 [Actinomycetota bacterium]|nr:hypothetical protein [Actinomycetota bacterium]
MLTSLGLTAVTASAAPGDPPGKQTTTTTSTTPSSTTTTVKSAGGSGGGGVANPKLTAVVALSRHRALATYDRDLDAAALDVASYAIYSTQAVNLPVTGVSRATNNQAFLLTGAQEPVTYEMKKPKTSRPVTFTGSTVNEPKLLGVRALSKTQIVVMFSEPVGASALQPTAYQITVEGSTATLAVNGAAAYGSTGKEVLLTTAPQQPVQYILKVGDIQTSSGVYMDPTAVSVQFTGSTVLPGPMLLGATSDGDTKVVLTFDVALDPASATSAANYTIGPNLSITSVTLQAENKQVVLITSPQYQGEYSVVANVKGADGNPANPSFNSATFSGSRPRDTERPKVVSAASTDNKHVVVQFSKSMADSTADPARFVIVQTVVHPEVGALTVTGAEFVAGTDRKSVQLTTLSQAEVTYQVTVNNVTDVMGNPLADRTNVAGVIVDPTSFTFPGTPPADCPGNPPPGTVATKGTTALTGTGTRFLTTFKAGDSVQVSGETPRTISAIASDTSLTVSTAFATTANGSTYRISCVGEPVNTDTDTLLDHEETRGWQITIKFADGNTQVRQVTSSPSAADTDADGLKDHEERALGTDPRDRDTDDDGIEDEAEFNVYYTDPANQDGDGDGLFDGLEATFFLTSPLLDDTDGDQLKDGYEINVNRNPKVADLPQPVLKVGEMRMGLDVRFTESNGTSTRQLDAKSVEATLVQSSSQAFGSSDSSSHETGATIAESAGQEFSIGYDGGFSVGANFSFNQSSEVSNTNSWSSEFTQTSSQSTEQAHASSLSTEVESATDSTVVREVVGADLRLAVSLESRGSIAFTARNLQVAALIQDPDDPKRLTPIGTLVPESGLETSFNLGPLVPPKGPIVFSSGNVYPQLVDDLMKNPRGLVFRFANYDIVDEGGRNFAFTSQEVNDRTARIAIDYGGFDPDGDGRGADTEILRVATGIIGRVVDTNGDGKVDDNDRKVVFDPNGKQVGITLRDALNVAGLKGYDEVANPSHTLSEADRQGSYSTRKLADGKSEGIVRIRNRQIRLNTPESWEIVARDGITRALSLDERILYPGTQVTLQFLADLDGDRLPALTEAVHGCKDSARDTDNDGLDDRFEVLIGWEVRTPLGRREVHSKCSRADSDGDGLTDIQEAPGMIKKDANGMVLIDAANAPRRNSGSPEGSIEAALEDPVTDPVSKDTDVDGLADNFELTPYKNALKYGDTDATLQPTSPEHPDTDADGLSDGVERKLGGNPRADDSEGFTDSDGDGLTDAQEVGDDNGDFEIGDDEQGAVDHNGDGVIDPDERNKGAGWNVTVVQKHLALDRPRDDPYRHAASIKDNAAGTRRHLVEHGQTLQVGMVVDIRNRTLPNAAPLNTSVDLVEPVASGDDAYVTFGTAFDGLLPNPGDPLLLNVYRTVCKNGMCPAQHATTVQRVYSSKYDADTDDDGLTDLEEKNLGTDPGCTRRPNADGEMVLDCAPRQTHKDLDKDGVRDGWDTDGDGLTDFQEVRGFKLRDGSTVKTKPTYVDTDNDRRSDGDEAGLPGGELIVRLPGGVIYEAFSNPTRADTDFDLLVDGDEQAFAIDPTLPNTDKDNQSDYSEIFVRRRPEVPDMSVTMEFIRLYVEEDAEKGGDAGDFRFEFNVVKPDTSQELVVHSHRGATGGADPLPLGQLGLPWSKPDGSCPDNNHEDRCFVTVGGITIVRIIDLQSLPFELNGQGRTKAIGSVSTTDAVPESFGVRGWLEERDNTDHTKTSCRVEIFPDAFGNAADGTGLVKGSTQLRPGEQSIAITRSITNCAEEPNLKFTLVVSYTAL